MIEAVIFDLDGVLVTTDELHYQAWKTLAESIGIDNFTKEDNLRQRGVSRMASLEIVLEKTDKNYTEEEKEVLAEKKNTMYVSSLATLSPEDVLPGVMDFIRFLKSKGIKTAIGSASKNTPLILEKTGIIDLFDEIVCGLDTQKSKPDPEVFLLGAQRLNISPERCVVIEDSDAGIKAAKSGGMYAVAVGAARNNLHADYSAQSLDDFDYERNDLFNE